MIVTAPDCTPCATNWRLTAIWISYPYKALVAFSGKVQDGGRLHRNQHERLQANAETFKHDEYRMLIVAEIPDRFRSATITYHVCG
jgi:hypothetical protein